MSTVPQRTFLWFGIISPLILIQATVLLGAINRNYNHVAETLSILGSEGMKLSILFNVSAIIFGLLLMLFSIGLWQNLKRYRLPIALTMGFIGLLNILGGMFPVDMEQLESTSSIIHVTTGLMFFASFVIVHFLTRGSIKDDSRFYGIRGSYAMAGLLGIVGIAITLGGGEYAGLGQIMFFFGFFSQIIIISVSLLRKRT